MFTSTDTFTELRLLCFCHPVWRACAGSALNMDLCLPVHSLFSSIKEYILQCTPTTNTKRCFYRWSHAKVTLLTQHPVQVGARLSLANLQRQWGSLHNQGDSVFDAPMIRIRTNWQGRCMFASIFFLINCWRVQTMNKCKFVPRHLSEI